jgi:predicted metalloprotease
MPVRAGGLGIGTIIIIGLISWYLGIDPSVLLNGAQILTGGDSTTQQGSAPPVAPGTPSDPTGKFVSQVLGDTEDRWTEIFSASGKTYHPPKLRLFAGSEPTPCAFARSAMGPFYCPRDQRIYLDTAFLMTSKKNSVAALTATPASFPRPTSSRMRLAIMCKMSLVFCRA